MPGRQGDKEAFLFIFLFFNFTVPIVGPKEGKEQVLREQEMGSVCHLVLHGHAQASQSSVSPQGH